jgi:hypothetical protein
MLSTSKCRFAASCCTFLGFCISENGLSCDPRLIEAIAQRPEPHKAMKNPKKEVASFVGLCSFYRRFVPGFAEIAEPLTRIMGKQKNLPSQGSGTERPPLPPALARGPRLADTLAVMCWTAWIFPYGKACWLHGCSFKRKTVTTRGSCHPGSSLAEGVCPHSVESPALSY